MSEARLEDTLSSILGNEELMGKISGILNSHNGDTNESLPDVVGLLRSSLGTDDSANPAGDDSSPVEEQPQNEGRSGFDSIVSSVSRCSSLLCALKPYLSEKRVQMIDNILKIEKITQIMKLTR